MWLVQSIVIWRENVDLQNARMLKLRCCRYGGDLQERKADYIGYTRGDKADIEKGVKILPLGKKNSKISESERIRFCREISGENLQVQMTLRVVIGELGTLITNTSP